MKELLAIAFIGLLIVLRMAAVYRKGKRLAKNNPVQLKPGDKVTYVPEMYD